MNSGLGRSPNRGPMFGPSMFGGLFITGRGGGLSILFMAGRFMFWGTPRISNGGLSMLLRGPGGPICLVPGPWSLGGGPWFIIGPRIPGLGPKFPWGPGGLSGPPMLPGGLGGPSILGPGNLALLGCIILGCSWKLGAGSLRWRPFLGSKVSQACWKSRGTGRAKGIFLLLSTCFSSICLCRKNK